MEVYNETKKHLDRMVVTFKGSRYNIKSVGNVIRVTLSEIGFDDAEYIHTILCQAITKIDPTQNIGVVMEVQDIGDDNQYILKITSHIQLDDSNKSQLDTHAKEESGKGGYLSLTRWKRWTSVPYLIIMTIFILAALTIFLIGWEKSMILLENKLGPWISNTIKTNIFGVLITPQNAPIKV